MRRRIFACVIAACMLGAVNVASATSGTRAPCTSDQASAADAALDHLDNWSAIQAQRRRFGHCDSGSIAEGHSEAVARLLVDHWDTLPQLVRLVQHDRPLAEFVLRHIDATLDSEDVRRIAASAHSQCPAGAAALCRRLERASRSLLNEWPAQQPYCLMRCLKSKPRREKPA